MATTTPIPPRGGNGNGTHLHRSVPPASPLFDPGPGSGVYVSNVYVTGATPAPQNTANAAALQQIADVVHNAFTARADLFRRAMDPRRNLNDEFGWPATEPTIEQYQDLYDRHPLASRVVEVLPKECWQVLPSVYEDEDSDRTTAFETAFDELPKQLRGTQSYFNDTEGTILWEKLLQADIDSGIGHYGCLLIGIDDGLDLALPAVGVEEANSTPGPKGATPSMNGVYKLTVNAEKVKGRKLLYVRSFPESRAQVVQVETNRSSPRYGKPTMYLMLVGDATNNVTSSLAGTQGGTQNVHWTRVVHVPDGETFVAPRMRAVLNPLLDTQKVYGADAESYLRNCLIKLLLETNAAQNTGGRVTIDYPSIRDEIEKFATGMQPYLALSDLAAKTVAPAVVDPTSHINVQVEAICIQIGIPTRIFKGSERGELASSQDDAAWNDRLKARQTGYLTPRVVVPFIDRLILLGVLPAPESGGYSVAWPDLTSQSDAERADVFSKRMAAFAQAIGGDVTSIMPPRELLTLEAGFTDEEADMILENAASAAEERMEEAQAFAEEGLGPDGMPVPTQPTVPGAEEEEDEDEAVENLLHEAFGEAGTSANPFDVDNVFCPTGPGGGVKPTCSPGGKVTTRQQKEKERAVKLRDKQKAREQAREEKSSAAIAKKREAAKAAVAAKQKDVATVIDRQKAEVPKRAAAADAEQLPEITAAGRQTSQRFAAAIDASNLSAPDKAAFRDGIEKISRRMPDAAHAAVAANVDTIAFHANKTDLTRARYQDEAAKARQETAERGWFRRVVDKIAGTEGLAEQAWEVAGLNAALTSRAAGAYYTDSKRMDLDGGTNQPVGMGRTDTLAAAHVHAHEIGHAIDGPRSTHSSSAAWRRAHEAEIAPGSGDAPLTRYARTAASEGFAEFSRLVYGGGFTAAEIQGRFPQASAYWKEAGLWPRHL